VSPRVAYKKDCEKKRSVDAVNFFVCRVFAVAFFIFFTCVMA
jgi:hypothetical protein